MKKLQLFKNAHTYKAHYWMEIGEDMVIPELCKRHEVRAVHLNANEVRELLNAPIDYVLELVDAYKNDSEIAGCMKFYKRIDC